MLFYDDDDNGLEICLSQVSLFCEVIVVMFYDKEFKVVFLFFVVFFDDRSVRLNK